MVFLFANSSRMDGVSDPRVWHSFVLDGSIAVSWCFPDEETQDVQKLMDALHTHIAVVPSLWFLEVSNAMLVGERRERLTQAGTAEAMRLLGQLPLRVDERSGFSLMNDVLALARQYSLTTYDAAYLELALRLHMPIATLDSSLRKAAKLAGVEEFKPSEDDRT